MKRITFSYGQYVVREGQIPAGMYIVKKGQCLIGIESIGFRSTKRRVFSKNEPEKLFAQEEKMKQVRQDLEKRVIRGFNNNLIYNDDKGEKLKTHIMYQNIVFCL